jgi:hypothetical protein
LDLAKIPDSNAGYVFSPKKKLLMNVALTAGKRSTCSLYSTKLAAFAAQIKMTSF